MNKVIVTIGQGVGDLVMGTPVISAVKSLGYHVSVLLDCNDRNAWRLLDGWKDVDEILTSPKAEKYDVLVKTLWGRNVSAKKKYFPDEMNKGIDAVMSRLKEIHEAEFNMMGARHLGFEEKTPLPHVEFDFYKEPLPLKYLAISPGWGGKDNKMWDRKDWPRWKEFCYKYNGEIVVLGSRNTKWDYEGENITNLIGRTTLREAAGIMKTSEAVLGIDSGLNHIAGALGCKALTLFGATNEVKNSPLGRNVEVVTAENISCRPCQHSDDWKRCGDWRCMREISVDSVLEKLDG